MAKSNPTSRYWCFTTNNYTDEDLNQLNDIGNSEDVRYLVYGKELSTLLTPHLQGFVIFNKPQRFNGALLKLPNGSHLEQRSKNSTNQQAADYCKKDDDYVEHGILKSQGHRSDLDVVADKIKQGVSMQDVAIDHSSTYIRNYRGIAAFKSLLTQDYTPDTVRGIWYVGSPGTGKSRKAREDNPEAYLKSQNKWWDGYAGEKVVIWDDLDRGAVGLGHHLKIWTDRYPCSGEIKGGIVKLQHDKMIVTSNYTIEDLWGEDPEMCAAIKRRFKVTRFRTL